ncbi:MAG: 30S ribosomal protein S1 [Bacteroidota bacterium]|nr:30S ribosomal protein S1 [Bacteroidota bacterium]MDP4233678.1 30S ribosomal protein S1 [Bacteroidota bacterium]MDP4241865.1 30S ribosomal protein S1 [Bacteroidota bacterium]MDP4288947.1 30S ribosomal protein S1 [Bacteroidota bacterium]
MTDINEQISPVAADATTDTISATLEAPVTNGHHHPETELAEIAEPAAPATAQIAPDVTPAAVIPATTEAKERKKLRPTTSSTIRSNQGGGRDRGNLTIIDPNIKLGGGYSKEEHAELEKLYGGALSPLKDGEIIKGRVVAITDGEVTIDIGFKSEGVISKSEFNLSPDLATGDEVEVFLESIEDKEGRLVLSRKQAEFTRTWQRIIEAQKTGEILQAKCMRRIKGGMVVDVLGVEAFLPGSQIDVKPVRDFDAFLGKTLDVRVVKINFPNENVVVSHKVLLEEHLLDQRKEIVEKLERGQVLEGTVKAIADFGAFVDLGGIDGLVHITDLTWGRVQHPSEVVKLDQVVTVVVLDYDENKRRISLGMKQLTPHPWAEIEQRYAVGQRVKGKVVSMTDYGAFIELEKGIEGLIHVSEMSWTQHVKHPSSLLTLGAETEAIILNIDQDSKKISLGLKQLEPDPWTLFLEKYPMGSKHHGIVRNITQFGAFVELEPGVDGLVHISDLSWTKKVRHPGEVLKKGQEIDVMILGIDLENRRISLGHKQVLDNPWENLETIYGEGKDVEGKIERIIEKGVIVELQDPSGLGIDGFVPISQLAFFPIKTISDSFHIDDTLSLRVIEFDAENHKIVLSATEWLKSQDRQALEEFNAKHPIPKETLEEMQKRREEPADGKPRRGRKKTTPAEGTGEVDLAKLVEQAPSPKELGHFDLPEEMMEPAPPAPGEVVPEPTDEVEG